MLRRIFRAVLPIVFSAALAANPLNAQTVTETILQSFGYFPQGDDPCGTLIRDAMGNLYGTAYFGGNDNLGTAFVFSSAGGYKLLHSFAGGADGANPYAGLTLDPEGNLYGTTYLGAQATWAWCTRSTRPARKRFCTRFWAGLTERTPMRS